MSGADQYVATRSESRNQPASATERVFYTLDEFVAELDKPAPWRDRPGIFAARFQTRLHRMRLALVRVWQRWRRGYSEEDTWSFDHFLSPVIAGGLTRLRERGLAHPTSVKAEEWDAILDAMIAGFTAAQKGPWEMDEADRATFKKGMAYFSHFYFDLWD